MPLSRRQFLFTSAISTAAGAALAGPALGKPANPGRPKALAPGDWASVRELFDLDPRYAHLSLFYLTSHPRPVREAIEEQRRRLDANPLLTVEHGMFDFKVKGSSLADRAANAIGAYIGAGGEDIALTGNTTTGLALIYFGLPLRADDEILTTAHDHYVHHEAIRLAVERAGASWRKVALYEPGKPTSADELAARVEQAIRPATRVVGVTWVHSCTGMKLPVRRIADAIAKVNRTRAAGRQVLLVVDGVHGLGVEDPKVTALGCDAFSAGTHKWIFGQRGTGFVWAKPAVWANMRPLIPTLHSLQPFEAWEAEKEPIPPARAAWFSPGGFQAFEHMWALPVAFDFHQKIGPARITRRIHQLNRQLKEGLARMPHVVLHTPIDEDLSAGMVCFEVRGLKPEQVVQRLLKQKIVASTTPYQVTYARIGCSIVNTPEEVEKTLGAVSQLS